MATSNHDREMNDCETEDARDARPAAPGIGRRTLVRSAASLSLGALAFSGLPARARAISRKGGQAKRHALFTYGGWPGHQPKKCRDIFVPWLRKEGFEVTAADTLDAYLDETLMKSLDLIVQIWTMGQIEKNQLRGLLGAINKRGVGIAGWHGGLGDAFRQQTEYQFMIGGQWVAHPGGIIGYRVNITDPSDPVTSGLSDFDLKTEQYYMHVDPNNKVLATTRFSAEHAYWIDGAVMPVSWKKIYGKGRVFYSSMGHTADVFDTHEALTITKRGILWASRSRHEETPNLIAPRYPTR